MLVGKQRGEIEVYIQVGAFEKAIEARRGRENKEQCSRGRKRVRKRRCAGSREIDLGIKSLITASMSALTFANDCQAILPYVPQIFCHRNFKRASIVIECETR